MLKQDVLAKCRESIRADLGSLDDLPAELANTVANVYYRFVELSEKVFAGDEQDEGSPIGWLFDSTLGDTAWIVDDHKSVHDFIKGLRAIDKQKKPNLYQYAVDLILDCLKYRIPNASEKNGFQRRIERRFRKNSVQEIPNLVDSLTPSQRAREAFEWYRIAAEQGDAGAQFMLGVLYDKGQGVLQDSAEASKWMAAEQGDAGARFMLGVLHDSGQVIEDDYAEIARSYQMTAEKGDVGAQCMLGVMYLTGKGVPQNTLEAVRWYRMAAERGHVHTQSLLGGLYYTGRGVPQDDAEAVRWYRMAAEQGDVLAQGMVGGMFRVGGNVPQDHAEAAKWCRMAAEQGNAGAQFILGVMHDKGEGIPQNYVEAHVWMSLAASRSQGEDLQKISSAKRMLVEKMTPDQIAEAQRLAREWNPKTWDELKEGLEHAASDYKRKLDEILSSPDTQEKPPAKSTIKPLRFVSGGRSKPQGDSTKTLPDYTHLGRYLGRAALDIVQSSEVAQFAQEFSIDGSLRERFEFALPIISIAVAIRLVHQSDYEKYHEQISDSVHEYYIEHLDQEESVRIGDLIMHHPEFEAIRSIMANGPFAGLSPDTLSTVYSIASLVYHPRQVEYLDLMNKSLRERDLLGPMGGVARRFYEQLTGFTYSSDDDSDEDTELGCELSPASLSLFLAGVQTTLIQDFKGASDWIKEDQRTRDSISSSKKDTTTPPEKRKPQEGENKKLPEIPREYNKEILAQAYAEGGEPALRKKMQEIWPEADLSSEHLTSIDSMPPSTTADSSVKTKKPSDDPQAESAMELHAEPIEPGFTDNALELIQDGRRDEALEVLAQAIQGMPVDWDADPAAGRVRDRLLLGSGRVRCVPRLSKLDVTSSQYLLDEGLVLVRVLPSGWPEHRTAQLFRSSPVVQPGT